MWRCVECGEKNEDPFKTCWQCEYPRDGLSTGFEIPLASAQIQAQIADDDAEAALAHFLARNYLCPRCRGRGAEIGHLFTAPLRVAPSPHQRLLTASCLGCGSTECFNAGLLLAGDWQAVLSRLFAD